MPKSTDPLITKRFHISGLTPALTQTEIFGRLSSFAVVKSIDGFGLLNGLNEPRNFAYVTLEGTASSLSRCVNLLSGSTWKGTKLRISEAKPDFRARLIRERETDIEPPRKKRWGGRGVEATDMSLVTPENVASRGGWKVTALGRIIKPIRMRPPRPLTNPLESRKTGNGKTLTQRRKPRIAVRRMRRRTIDPTMWGSVHLKGNFLDAEQVPKSTKQNIEDEDGNRSESGSYDCDSDENSLMKRTTHVMAVSSSPSPLRPTLDIDLVRENTRSMTIVQSLFSSSGEMGWDGRESVSEMEMDEDRPRQGHLKTDKDNSDVDAQNDVNITGQRPENLAQSRTQLKDLFAPRQDAGDFSIVGHLGLDLGLYDDSSVSHTSDQPITSSARTHPGIVSVQPPRVASFDVDSKQPLFFPASKGDGVKYPTKDMYDIARERGWNWRDPAVGFWRTETEEEIRAKWESEKVELTRSWKKRWREAWKTKKRVGGGDGEVEVE